MSKWVVLFTPDYRGKDTLVWVLCDPEFNTEVEAREWIRQDVSRHIVANKGKPKQDIAYRVVEKQP